MVTRRNRAFAVLELWDHYVLRDPSAGLFPPPTFYLAPSRNSPAAQFALLGSRPPSTSGSLGSLLHTPSLGALTLNSTSSQGSMAPSPLSQSPLVPRAPSLPGSRSHSTGGEAAPPPAQAPAPRPLPVVEVPGRGRGSAVTPLAASEKRPAPTPAPSAPAKKQKKAAKTTGRRVEPKDVAEAKATVWAFPEGEG